MEAYWIIFLRKIALCCLICSEVRIEGLETLDFFDNLMRRDRFTEQADAITFDCEVTKFSYTFTIFFPSKWKFQLEYCSRLMVLSKDIMCFLSDW